MTTKSSVAEYQSIPDTTNDEERSYTEQHNDDRAADAEIIPLEENEGGESTPRLPRLDTVSHLRLAPQEAKQNTALSAVSLGSTPSRQSSPSSTLPPVPALQFQNGTSNHIVGTVLYKKGRQLRWIISVCAATIPLSVLIFIYVYEALVSNNPFLGPLLFNPSRTLLVVTILSQGIGLLIKLLFSCVFEALRWHLVSRESGVGMSTFLGLSPATSFLGVLRLLINGGKNDHIVWCLQRFAAKICLVTIRLLLPVICFLITVILKGAGLLLFTFALIQNRGFHFQEPLFSGSNCQRVGRDSTHQR